MVLICFITSHEIAGGFFKLFHKQQVMQIKWTHPCLKSFWLVLGNG